MNPSSFLNESTHWETSKIWNLYSDEFEFWARETWHTENLRLNTSDVIQRENRGRSHSYFPEKHRIWRDPWVTFAQIRASQRRWPAFLGVKICSNIDTEQWSVSNLNSTVFEIHFDVLCWSSFNSSNAITFPISIIWLRCFSKSSKSRFWFEKRKDRHNSRKGKITWNGKLMYWNVPHAQTSQFVLLVLLEWYTVTKVLYFSYV
jgi:hypothetical protein